MGSKFYEDNLNYTIGFHTDLQDMRLENYDDHYTIKRYFQSDSPKLIAKGNPSEFEATLGIRNLMYSFSSVQRTFHQWKENQGTISDSLPPHLSAYQPAFYIKQAKDVKVTEEELEADFASIDIEEVEFTIGSREIKISDIESAGKLNDFKKDLKADIKQLEHLAHKLKHFEDQVKSELSGKNLHKSNDLKLEKLMQSILKTSENKKNGIWDD